jgi:multidrug efflux pump subunit AcrA (membrane-fusion protein)
VRWDEKPRQLSVVPASAILRSRDGPYVLVDAGDPRALEKRCVELGRIFGTVAVVLAGVHTGERVLVRNAFFFDAERRLRETSP